MAERKMMALLILQLFLSSYYLLSYKRKQSRRFALRPHLSMPVRPAEYTDPVPIQNGHTFDNTQPSTESRGGMHTPVPYLQENPTQSLPS
jgi:hypothetical protein